MKVKNLLMLASAFLTACLHVGAGLAQNAQPGPVRITTPFPAGSGPDVVTRVLAEKLALRWGVGVVVEAKPGANGFLAVNAVKHATANGTELLIADVGHLSINPLIFRKLPYDPEVDLVPVTVVYKTAFFVAVGANSGIRSIKDLTAQALASPGKTTYGSNAVGGPLHLGAAQFEGGIGAQMLHVPFKELSQLYGAVSNGDVTWAYGSIATAGALARAGKLRFIAIADRTRSPNLPDVPTLEEAGGPKGIDATSFIALMGPKGMNAALAESIGRAANEALALPDVRERMAGFGFNLSPGAPSQVTNMMRSERARYVDLVKRLNVSTD